MTHKPTPEQTSIIDFIRDNPDSSLMVSARAGAAKTSTILMATEVIDQPCLALAFNKKIQIELEERIGHRPNITTKTLNGLGHAAWARRLDKRLQVDADKMFKIAKAVVGLRDDDMMVDVLNLSRKAKSSGLVPIGAPPSAPSLCPDTTEQWEDLAFSLGIEVTNETEVFCRQVLLQSINQAFQGVIDFDDQIYMSVLFGGVYPKFHTVIVDEAQDLSPMNHRQLAKACGTRCIAIGDPYQAIYAFRGADSNSMTNLMEVVGNDFTQLSLTYSFRCPHAVAIRQLEHVSDFKAWGANPIGTVEHWPKSEIKDTAESRQILTDLRELGQDAVGMPYTIKIQKRTSWSIDEIPLEGAIICRNNAPLMALAFTLIKARRPVKILGRDIGANLANQLLKIAGRGKNRDNISVEDMIPMVNAWAQGEFAKAAGSQSKADLVRDKQDCLIILLEASGAKTVKEAADFIRNLFSDKGEKLVLSSGHRSKGLEWDWVMHLDPFRCPSRFAIKRAEQGDPGPLIQEMNLRYVIETRTKGTLVMASLEDCEESGS